MLGLVWGGSERVMGEWLVDQWILIVGVIRVQKIFGFVV